MYGTKNHSSANMKSLSQTRGLRVVLTGALDVAAAACGKRKRLTLSTRRNEQLEHGGHTQGQGITVLAT
ncbi:MAG: hypothetical protein ACYTAO_19110 [Planctomycetota bacterium]|jgi:hypothetical protein